MRQCCTKGVCLAIGKSSTEVKASEKCSTGRLPLEGERHAVGAELALQTDECEIRFETLRENRGGHKSFTRDDSG